MGNSLINMFCARCMTSGEAFVCLTKVSNCFDLISKPRYMSSTYFVVGSPLIDENESLVGVASWFVEGVIDNK